MTLPKPTVLIILDGWGYRAETENNAILLANTPTWDALLANCPHLLLNTSGNAVGLPDNQMGNSEVGHLTLGAGRIIDQDLTRINKAISNQSFFNNNVLKTAFQKAQTHHTKIHILGCLSPGGVHAHTDHILALIKMAQGYDTAGIYVHAFLDGRDTPPQSAKDSIQKLESWFLEHPKGQIASLIGRYYAMDRDQRWDRIQKAYDLITQGSAPFQSTSASEGLRAAYDRGETDEFVQATLILENNHPITLEDKDVVVFANFRADRARALTRTLIDPTFLAFLRQKQPKLLEFVSMTEYDKTYPHNVVFPQIIPQNTLGECLQAQHLTQLRLAETEKYAHVTFFLNGGQEAVFEGETRYLVPSAQVATYDLKPQMRALEITDYLIKAIENKTHDVIICNYANADMVGHTGKCQPTILAIETLDHCLAQITRTLKECGGQAIITADHGNAELMYDPKTNQAHTAHTLSKVPCLYVGPSPLKTTVLEGGLKDVAPSLLHIMGLPIPHDMTGQPLFIQYAKS